MEYVTPLPALAVAVPLTGAAFLAGATLLGRRRIMDSAAIGLAAATAVICAVLLVQSTGGLIVYWFGGWEPSNGVALGISFAIDPLGASMALLAAALTTAALVFSWRYFEAVGGLYHALMLVFLAAMVGFTLSGDLFNMFVFFELMGVAAFALTGYKVEESEPLQGALNFGVTNGIAAFLILMGLGLLYGRTGALNLAQLGAALAGREIDGLIVVSFAVLVAAFLIKSAMVPFHFWLADAYAVAPAPVCVLLSAVMSELGIYALARIYWSVFAGALGGHGSQIKPVTVGIGVVTALIAAIMCFLQRRLKRILAFATMSHAGLFVVGVGLLTPAGLGGVAVYVLADAMVKTTLFFSVGILLHRYGSGDERHLQGRGRDFPFAGVLLVVGAFGLAGLPPLGTWLGKSLIEDEAVLLGYSWMPAVFLVVSVLTGATVLRAAGRIFLASEAPDGGSHADGEDEEAETSGGEGRTPLVMVIPAVLFALLAFAPGLLPGLDRAAEGVAHRFEDRSAYERAVLEGAPQDSHSLPPDEPSSALKGGLLGVVSSALAVALAWVALVPQLWPSALPRALSPLSSLSSGMRALHSGHVGDYVAWLTVGFALLGGLFALVLL
jgi:multicomponent Na+:H+ antiporter subunit D